MSSNTVFAAHKDTLSLLKSVTTHNVSSKNQTSSYYTAINQTLANQAVLQMQDAPDQRLLFFEKTKKVSSKKGSNRNAVTAIDWKNFKKAASILPGQLVDEQNCVISLSELPSHHHTMGPGSHFQIPQGVPNSSNGRHPNGKRIGTANQLERNQ